MKLMNTEARGQQADVRKQMQTKVYIEKKL